VADRAFIGEPADAQGKPACCAYCSRRAFMRIRGEELCLRHIFPAERERHAAAIRRAKEGNRGRASGTRAKYLRP
jgi:hypothetical protein